MALAARRIKFKIEKGTKRPKAIDEKNSVFILYASEKLKIKPQEFKFAYLNTAFICQKTSLVHILLCQL